VGVSPARIGAADASGFYARALKRSLGRPGRPTYFIPRNAAKIKTRLQFLLKPL